MSDYLSRHPSPSNVKNQIKADEIWNNLFTVKETKCRKPVLDEQKQIGGANQPITGELSETNERSNLEKAASVIEENKQTKQTIKSSIATFNANDCDSKTDKMSSTDSENETSTIEFANEPQLKLRYVIQ